jgi:HEAT repeat protein
MQPNRLVAFLPALLMTLSAVSAADKPGPYRPNQSYGNAEDVALLAGLLDGQDPYVRQQALRALGETNNPADAAGPIGQAFGNDKDTGVRLAALRAAWTLPHPERDALLRRALSADAPEVLQRGGLRIVRRSDANVPPAAVRALLTDQSPRLIADALGTLSHLNQAAPPKRLAALLDHESAAVRLRAAENALLLNGDDVTKPLVDALAEASDDRLVAVRAAAVTAWAVHNSSRGAEQLRAAWTSDDPQMRRAAVRAWGRLGRHGQLDEALGDKSAMVRLAAIRSVGMLGDRRYVPALFERLAEAPGDSHRAARRALLQIEPSGPVAEAAAAWLTDTPGNPKIYRRNQRAALWLLAELKSDVAMEQRIRMLSSLPIDSDALAECARGLAATGAAKARRPLRDLLGRTIRQAKRYLSSATPVPYSQEVTTAAMEALAEMNADDALPQVIEAGQIKYLDARLGRQSAIAARVAARLVEEGSTTEVAQFLSGMMTDPHQSTAAKYHACIAAGEMKASGTTGALRQLIEKDRPGRQVLQAAAWALSEITGEPVKAPQPPSSPGRTWILRRQR